MAKPNTTAWLSGDLKPCRIGIYQRDYRVLRTADRSFGIAYSYWDGKQWGLGDSSRKGAVLDSDVKSSHQALPWRGLAALPAQGHDKGGEDA